MDDLRVRLLRLRAGLRRRRRPEQTGTPFLARAQAAVPQIDERLEAPLQRVELETIHGDWM